MIAFLMMTHVIPKLLHGLIMNPYTCTMKSTLIKLNFLYLPKKKKGDIISARVQARGNLMGLVYISLFFGE